MEAPTANMKFITPGRGFLYKRRDLLVILSIFCTKNYFSFSSFSGHWKDRLKKKVIKSKKSTTLIGKFVLG